MTEGHSKDIVTLFDLPISRMGMEQLVANCSERLVSRRGGYVCFVNVHSLTESRSNPGLFFALKNSYMNAADGLPLVWLSKVLKAPVQSRVCGPDFTEYFLRKHSNLLHGFIGGSSGNGEALLKRYQLNGVSFETPHRPYTDENALDDWKEFTRLSKEKLGSIPDLIWVGLGAPKQELWMQKVTHQAPNTLFFGIGAAFDFLTGTKSRAPLWMQRVGLEWFFRLANEPGRLGKRYFLSNSLFIFSSARTIARRYYRNVMKKK